MLFATHCSSKQCVANNIIPTNYFIYIPLYFYTALITKSKKATPDKLCSLYIISFNHQIVTLCINIYIYSITTNILSVILSQPDYTPLKTSAISFKRIINHTLYSRLTSTVYHILNTFPNLL